VSSLIPISDITAKNTSEQVNANGTPSCQTSSESTQVVVHSAAKSFSEPVVVVNVPVSDIVQLFVEESKAQQPETPLESLKKKVQKAEDLNVFFRLTQASAHPSAVLSEIVTSIGDAEEQVTFCKRTHS
jgi:hypothetical protein